MGKILHYLLTTLGRSFLLEYWHWLFSRSKRKRLFLNGTERCELVCSPLVVSLRPKSFLHFWTSTRDFWQIYCLIQAGYELQPQFCLLCLHINKQYYSFHLFSVFRARSCVTTITITIYHSRFLWHMPGCAADGTHQSPTNELPI